MPLSKEQKRQRRAAAAGPNPRPRGRAPVGANGVEKEWDREHGVWIELALGVAEQQVPPPTWLSLGSRSKS